MTEGISKRPAGLDPLETAEDLLPVVGGVIEDNEELLKEHRLVRASLLELFGLLTGVQNGRITSGCGRVSELITTAIREWPADKAPDEVLFDMLDDVGTAGLSVAGVEFRPPRRGQFGGTNR